MIKSLKLTNFQCHKQLDLDFSPKVNCIIGASDSGKSAVIRALNWVTFNRPSGDAYIRNGSKEATAEIVTDNATIKRIKSSTKNYYEVNGNELKAVGTSVPDDVTKALNLDTINFQGQHDSPYMLSNTAGEVGKAFNNMVDLTTIDRVLLGLNREIKDYRKEMAFVEEQKNKYKEELNQYKNIKEMKEKLQDITSLYSSMDKNKETIKGLSEVIEDAKKIQDKLDLSLDYTLISNKIEKIKTQWQDLKAKDKELSELQDIVSSSKRIALKVSDMPDYTDINKRIDAIREKADKMDKLDEKINDFDHLIENIQRVSEKIKIADKSILDMEKTLKDEMGDVCPLCKQGIK